MRLKISYFIVIASFLLLTRDLYIIEDFGNISGNQWRRITVDLVLLLGGYLALSTINTNESAREEI